MCRVVEVLADGSEVDIDGGYWRRQYINLGRTRRHRDYGRVVRLKAQVERVAGDPSWGLWRHAVYWRFNSSGPSSTAVYGGYTSLPGSMKAGFGTGHQGTRMTTTDAQGWTGEVDFYLGKYGGDEFSVWVSEQRTTGGLRAGKYHVWRRVYCELECMRRSNTGTYANRAQFARVQAAYRPQFVDLRSAGADSRPAHRRMLRDTYVDSWAAPMRHRSTTGWRRYVEFFFIDTIAWDVANQSETVQIRSNPVTLNFTGYLLDHETPVSGDGSTWFRSATGRQGTTSRNIPRSKFTLGWTADPTDRFTVRVDLTGCGFNLSNLSSAPVRVTINFRSWTEGSGLSTGPRIYMGVRFKERDHAAQAADRCLNTTIHELGHSLGLVPSVLPDGSTNSTYVRTTGGPHCNYGTDDCVMYASNTAITAFCGNCKDCLKGRDMSRLPIRSSTAFS